MLGSAFFAMVFLSDSRSSPPHATLNAHPETAILFYQVCVLAVYAFMFLYSRELLEYFSSARGLFSSARKLILIATSRKAFYLSCWVGMASLSYISRGNAAIMLLLAAGFALTFSSYIYYKLNVQYLLIAALCVSFSFSLSVNVPVVILLMIIANDIVLKTAPEVKVFFRLLFSSEDNYLKDNSVDFSYDLLDLREASGDTLLAHKNAGEDDVLKVVKSINLVDEAIIASFASLGASPSCIALICASRPLLLDVNLFKTKDDKIGTAPLSFLWKSQDRLSPAAASLVAPLLASATIKFFKKDFFGFAAFHGDTDTTDMLMSMLNIRFCFLLCEFLDKLWDDLSSSLRECLLIWMVLLEQKCIITKYNEPNRDLPSQQITRACTQWFLESGLTDDSGDDIDDDNLEDEWQAGSEKSLKRVDETPDLSQLGSLKVLIHGPNGESLSMEDIPNEILDQIESHIDSAIKSGAFGPGGPPPGFFPPEYMKRKRDRESSTEDNANSNREVEAPNDDGIIVGKVFNKDGKPFVLLSEKQKKLPSRMFGSPTPSPISLPLALKGITDPDYVFANLQKRAPWMADASEILAKAAARNRHAGLEYYRLDKPVLLVGPSGYGKTYWCRLAADTIGLPYHRLALSGGSDSASLMGNDRVYSGSSTSYPVDSIISSLCANPMLMVDELDKAATSRHNGDPIEGLLSMTDQSRSEFKDAYFKKTISLEFVSWVMAANTTDGIHQALLDRCHVVHVKRPTILQVQSIVPYLVEDISKSEGVDIPSYNVDDLKKKAEQFWQEGGSLRSVFDAIKNELFTDVWVRPDRRLKLVEKDD
jgi:hypothetical protein